MFFGHCTLVVFHKSIKTCDVMIILHSYCMCTSWHLHQERLVVMRQVNYRWILFTPCSVVWNQSEWWLLGDYVVVLRDEPCIIPQGGKDMSCDNIYIKVSGSLPSTCNLPICGLCGRQSNETGRSTKQLITARVWRAANAAGLKSNQGCVHLAGEIFHWPFMIIVILRHSSTIFVGKQHLF